MKKRTVAAAAIPLLFVVALITPAHSRAPQAPSHRTAAESTPLAWAPAPSADQPAHPLKSAELRSPDDPRKARIKAIDTQIQALRAEMKAQVDPLEDQIKALRDKFDAQIQTLQAERKTLVEQGESPGLRALYDDESRQLAALAEREKSEIAEVRERFKAERSKLEQDFQNRRRELEAGKK